MGKRTITPSGEKFLPLEFLRFIMAIGICYAHLLSKLTQKFIDLDFKPIFSGASHATFAVPAFFIISGFFLKSDGELGDFVAKKIIRLWPMLACSILIHIGNGYDLLGLLFLNDGLGIINKTNANPAIWYVCVLFWVLICFYLFLKYTDIKKQVLTLILISYFALFLICHRGSSYNQVVAPFLTLGVVYGIFGVSFGILFRKFWQASHKLFDNLQNEKIIFTILEVILVGGFIYVSAFYKGFLHPLCYILLFTAVFYVILLAKGFISTIFAKLSVLGRYSYSMYLMQFPCFYFMNKWLWNNFQTSNRFTIILVSLAGCGLSGGGVSFD